MKSDYHIHYYLDSCADKEMTLENIDRKAYETGLTDITVVKHYSYCLPNGKEHWAC